MNHEKFAGLSEDEISFIRFNAQHCDNQKFKDRELYSSDPDAPPLYEKAEKLGYLVCNGGHRWEVTVKGHRALALDYLDRTAPHPGASHPDDFAVDHFAAALKSKMATSREKGRSGWNDPLLCNVELLRRLLVNSVRKGDPVDVGNFAMMLFIRGATAMLPAIAEEIDKQMAVIDSQRQARLDRRLQNVPVEFDRRAGVDRRIYHPKG